MEQHPKDTVVDAPRGPHPGAIVAGSYRLLRKLGEGGIGEVWLAEHGVLKTHVAIKVLKHAREGGAAWHAEALDRFRFESQISARLAKKSKSMVAVHDAGESQIGHYLVMELVEGGTLSDEVESSGSISVERFADVLEPVVEALEVAHGEGIVHRDLKPTNILIGKDASGRPVVKVTDFGIAKATNREIPLDLPKPTGFHMLLGSPGYMSPEQLTAGSVVDARTDVWALGVVAYEALTGAVAFEGESPSDILLNMFVQPPRRASSVKPGLPPALDAWFTRALAKEPANRFQTVREMLEAYKAAVARQPTRTGFDSTVRPPRRARVGMPLAAIGAVVIAASIVLAVRAKRTDDAVGAPLPTISAPEPTAAQLPPPQTRAPDPPPSAAAPVATTSAIAPSPRPPQRPTPKSKPSPPPETAKPAPPAPPAKPSDPSSVL